MKHLSVFQFIFWCVTLMFWFSPSSISDSVFVFLPRRDYCDPWTMMAYDCATLNINSPLCKCSSMPPCSTCRRSPSQYWWKLRGKCGGTHKTATKIFTAKNSTNQRWIINWTTSLDQVHTIKLLVSNQSLIKRCFVSTVHITKVNIAV